jgi:hypothetical protein
MRKKLTEAREPDIGRWDFGKIIFNIASFYDVLRQTYAKENPRG